MCGIIGSVSSKDIKKLLVDGLSSMEYRGYDSAGVALGQSDTVVAPRIVRKVGRVQELADSVAAVSESFTQGIAHTRWATHGVPSEINAHPHEAKELVLVHNGIIENHAEIKLFLADQGEVFQSQTDTEVFAKLIDHELRTLDEGSQLSQEKVLSALRIAASKVQGHYAVLFMVRQLPGKLFVLQSGAPIVVGNAAEGPIVASDLQAILPHTQEVSFIPVGTLGVVSQEEISFETVSGGEAISVGFEKIDWSPEKVAKDGFDHFMLKEIFQQPSVVADTLSGRMPNSELGAFVWDNPTAHEALWKNVKKIHLVACGSAYHAAMVAKYYFERWARVSVEVDIASEFRYRSPVLEVGTIVGVVSQSGETADTLAALRLANESGMTTFSVCNVPGSTIMRESNFQYATKAGPEVGVASTKAFMAQMTVLCALAYDVARIRGMSPSHGEFVEGYRSLARLPQDIEKVLTESESFQALGASLKDKRTVLFVGRGTLYPMALEGALKLKEITYRHAEGYAAGELKHGPLALVDKDLATVVLAPRDHLHAKTLSNLEEIKSRGGYIIGIGEENDSEFQALSDRYISMPPSTWSSAPMLYTLPTQLISYGLARELGCDIDKPRNLAKSVTVE